MKILAIGDFHAPFHDVPALDWAVDIAKKFQPDAIVQMGDLFDFYSFSRYSRSFDLMTPAEEVREGRLGAETMWKCLKDASPDARCYQLLGNHDARVFKLISGKAPELANLFDVLNIHSLWEFEGVETQATDRDELVLDNTIFTHGHRTKLGDHMRYYKKSVVCGHAHKGGVVFMRCDGETLFELNAGFIANPTSPVMSYTSASIYDTTLGLGLIDSMGPRFIPYPG